MSTQAVALTETIEKRICWIRGYRVMLDRDLAELYGVETFNLNKAVKRNIERFPADFMFQLSKTEYDSLRFQIGILKRGQHAKYLPYAFTQEGVAMLSNVLKSQRAVEVNIAIMRAFVRLRQMLVLHKDLAQKLEEMEKKYNRRFRIVFDAIYQLMAPKPPPLVLPDIKVRRSIGFSKQKRP